MCKPGDKQRVFSPAISAQMSRCMCLCVSYIAPFTKTSAPIFIWLRSREETGQWAEIPSLWFLSLRPLPVLLDICIRHSFESQNRNIKVFSVPLILPLRKNVFPEDTGAQITRGKRTTQTNKREGNAVKLWCFLFSFEALISRLCEWTVLVHSFYGKCSLNVNKLYLLLLENILYGKRQINRKFAFSLFVLCSLKTPAWYFQEHLLEVFCFVNTNTGLI